MKRIAMIAVVVAAGSVALAAPPSKSCDNKVQTSRTETFADNGNEGAWTWGNGADTIALTGGSPKEFFKNDSLSTFAPRFRTTTEKDSVFTGNLRARDVVEVSAEFKYFNSKGVNTTTAERPLSLMFVNFNGTPDIFNDDKFVFYVGEKNIPEGGGWKTYTFDVPTGDLTAPTNISTVEGDPGWVIAEGEIFIPAADPDAVWNDVMQDVDQMIFWWHDPRFFALIQEWGAGADNVSVLECSD